MMVSLRSVSLLVFTCSYLPTLSNIIDKENISLYREDGLSAIENANRPRLDRWRKYGVSIFSVRD